MAQEIKKQKGNSKLTRKVLLTGLKKTSEKAASMMTNTHLEPIVFPLQTTIQLATSISGSFDWVIFTSSAAVEHFFSIAPNNRPNFQKVACVGPSTENALNKYHKKAELMPQNYNSESLVKVFPESTFEQETILYPCSELAEDEITEGLTEKGYLVSRVNTYRPEPSPKIKLPEFDDIIFFSGSAVKTMFEYFGPNCLTDKRVAVIGNKTACSLAEYYHIPGIVADESTVEGVIQALL